MRDKLSNITLRLAKKYTDSHGGGGGGSTDYRDLDHQPEIEGVTLVGNKSFADLGAGALVKKDSVGATYTPAGSVSVSQGTDSTASVGSVTSVGTLPALEIEGTKLKFTAGQLPTSESVTVVTASGTRSASFSGTEATITSE